MDKKRKTVLIAVAAILLVVAIFLLPRRSQPLGELIPAPETARVDGLFYISTIVPTPDGYGTFDTGDCRVEGYPDSEAAAALRSAMSEISVQRYYRLPTSLSPASRRTGTMSPSGGSPKTDRSTTYTSTRTRASSTTMPTPPSPTRSTATRSRRSVSSAPSSASTARTPDKIQQ